MLTNENAQLKNTRISYNRRITWASPLEFLQYFNNCQGTLLELSFSLWPNHPFLVNICFTLVPNSILSQESWLSLFSMSTCVIMYAVLSPFTALFHTTSSFTFPWVYQFGILPKSSATFLQCTRKISFLAEEKHFGNAELNYHNLLFGSLLLHCLPQSFITSPSISCFVI